MVRNRALGWNRATAARFSPWYSDFISSPEVRFSFRNSRVYPLIWLHAVQSCSIFKLIDPVVIQTWSRRIQMSFNGRECFTELCLKGGLVVKTRFMCKHLWCVVDRLQAPSRICPAEIVIYYSQYYTKMLTLGKAASESSMSHVLLLCSETANWKINTSAVKEGGHLPKIPHVHSLYYTGSLVSPVCVVIHNAALSNSLNRQGHLWH